MWMFFKGDCLEIPPCSCFSSVNIYQGLSTMWVTPNDPAKHIFISVLCSLSGLTVGDQSQVSSPACFLPSYLHYCFISVFLPEEASDMAPGSLIIPACLASERFRGGSAVITQCEPKTIRSYETGFKINLLFSAHLDSAFNLSDLL